MKNEELKNIVKGKYSEIAEQNKQQNETSCCGSGCGCGNVEYTVFSEDYKNIQGYNPDADMGLGCGIPTQFANIKLNDTVLDLGSGAGNDCFVARSIVGENGKIIGLDFTDIMIEKANKNVAKLGFKNISFIKGDIEQMPVESGSVDVVISNCVLNLVPDKQKAFSEIFRILKQDAHFCVSDVVIVGELPEHIRKSAELYAGCVSGAVQKNEYVDFIKKAGFKNVQIHKEKQVEIPDSTLEMIFSKEELIKFKESKVGIYSITVSAVK